MRPAGRARQARPPVHLLRRDPDHGPARRPRDPLRQVRAPEREPPGQLRDLRRAGRPEAQVRRGRVPGARDDLRRPAQGHDPPRRLGQGRRDRRQDHPRHQGAGGLLRRHPADDGERDLHHQRHGARHRQPAPPFAGCLLLAAREGSVRGADHPLPRQLGGVRVRLQEPAARAHRPQAQVPGLGLPARARHEIGPGDPEALLPLRPDRSARGTAVLEGLAEPRRPQALEERPRSQGRQRPPARGRARGQEDQPGAPRRDPAPRHPGDRDHRGRPRGRAHGRGHRRPAHGRGRARGQRAALAARPVGRALGGQPDRLVRGALLRPRRDRADAVDDGEEGHDQEPRGGPDRDLPADAPRRPADARVLAQPVRRHVPELAEVRLLAGRPAQAQHQARPVARR